MALTAETGSATKTRWTAQWHELVEEVVRPGLCTGCAGCVIACPHDVLDLHSGTWQPQLREQARVDGDDSRCARGERGCTLCTRACPRFRTWEVDADREMFGRTRTPDEPIGMHQGAYLVEATDEQIAATGQDGGFATALLAYALDNDYIDGALVSYYDEDWQTRPGVATNRKELLAAAGSRYTYSANTLAYQEAVGRGLSRLALVGMGCQTSMPPAATARGARATSRRIALTVGLLCSRTFDDDIFEGLFEARYGVTRREIVKINIKGRLQLWLDRDKDGDYLEIPLKEAREWTRAGCIMCPDFGAEHADLSLGGIGAFPGRTLTLPRSDLGIELLAFMARDGWVRVYDATEDDPAAVFLTRNLAIQQRKRWPAAPPPPLSPHPEPGSLPGPSEPAAP